jgi:polar amino acid transport system substrate-binding protein
MLQLTQQLRSGKMEILEVPQPGLLKGQVLVRNHYSVISAGTESKTVADARKGLIAKVRGRQKEARQVLESVSAIGLKETYNLVMNKLGSPSPLGYSCAGEVIAVGEGVTDLKPGELVACGGQGAFHAEVVAVYRNLCVKVPQSVDMRQAAFATIAAIALQGIRQAEVQIGGHAVVIGLGLIGQLTLKLLETAGVKAIGIDTDQKIVELCQQRSEAESRLVGITRHLSPVTCHTSPLILNRNQNGLESVIESETHGHGADAVIITAGTSSLDPVELAGALCRKKGKVVVVGAVPTGFSRENYYRKELDLRMSTSYGPGRYDPTYEEKGIDYPIGYVRFTENRNMQAFIDLLESGKLDISSLITHEYPLEKAPEAYDMILGMKEPYAGIVLYYQSPVIDGAKQRPPQADQQRSEAESRLVRITRHPLPVTRHQSLSKGSLAGVGLIGAGNFAQNILLPRMKGLCNFTAIATLQGNESVYLQRKYGFSKVYSDGSEVIRDPDVNTVFVLTRHDSHAFFVSEALKAGKNVFVEKPLALTEPDLEEIKKIVSGQWSAVSDEAKASTPVADQQRGEAESRLVGITRHPSPVTLMLGFNRRFAPMTKELLNALPAGLPKAINIRVNAGMVPPGHWVNDPETGGGRIIGEACHFLDLAMHIAGSPITSVYATTLSDPHGLNNTVHISLGFVNGGIATIAYYSNGSKKIYKEYIEVFAGGQVAIIDDFRRLYVNKAPNSNFKIQNSKFFSRQDKGHRAELEAFFGSIRSDGPAPIPFEEIYHSSLATFKALESLRTREKISISV